MLSNFIPGVNPDQVKFVEVLMIQYPLAYIISLLKVPVAQLMFNFIVGLILQFYMFGSGAWHSLGLTLVCYFCMKFFSKNLQSKIIFIVSMGWLSFYHLYRMIYDYGQWTLDINVVLMINVCKHTSVAFCYSDSSKENDELTQEQQRLKIDQVPELCEYLGYIFFVPGCIIGPFFEIKDFLNFVYKNDDYAYENKISKMPTVVKKFILGVLFAFIYVFTSKISNSDIIIDNNNEYSNLDKIIAISLAFSIKYRYFVGWLFTESILAVSGFNYQRKVTLVDSKEIILENYDRVVNLNIEELELKPDPRTIFKYWNIPSHLWLKKYVRDRFISKNCTNKFEKYFAFIMTFLVSAFWHGFYPSYYIMFSHFPFMILLYHNIAKISKISQISERFNPHLINIVHKLSCLLLMNMTGMIFVSLDYQKALSIMSKTYYLFSIYIFGGFIVSILILKFLSKKKIK